MNRLKEKIAALIRMQGPLTVSQYMSLALADPQFGYYQTAEPFGHAGDFITAPEISQLFGEMVAIWAVGAWEGLGRPSSFVLAEMGPGRGTLMADILRTIHKIAPEMAQAAHINLIESSPRLTNIQQKTLADYKDKVTWHEQFSNLPKKPLIFIANELFDALPIHQFVIDGGKLKERIVTLNQDGALAFSLAQHGPSFPVPALSGLPDGTIIELSPTREGLMDEIATHIAKTGGQALLIDYGSLTPATGDTLQALCKHKSADVFAAPGQHDLTSHVDFAALKTVAQKQKCVVTGTTQGAFLLALGLLERAGQLGYGKDMVAQQKIRDDVERLAAPEQMGNLFKVLIVSDKIYSSPIFASSTD